MAESFDPFAQSVTLHMADGTPFNITMPDLETFNLYNVRACIDSASQLGASLLLFVVLLLLTKPDKRVSILFAVNAASLVFNFIRTLLLSLYYTGGFSVPYAYFAGDYSRLSAADYGTQIAADVFSLLVLICVEFSLILQANVVCVTMRKVYRYTIMAFSSLVALLAILFRLVLTIENSKSILDAQNFDPWVWLASATNIVTTISICSFCAIFSIKLGFALHQRRKMGLRQFGPMQVVFIMGCQTMVIPAIFSILQYYVDAPEISTNVLTISSILLPLSSIWASISLDGKSQPSGVRATQQKFFGSYASGSSTTPLRSAEKGGSGSGSGVHPHSPTDTALTPRSDGGKSITHGLHPGNVMSGRDADADLEAQGLGIHVDRQFCLHEGRV